MTEDEIVEKIEDCFDRGGKLLICGNGGSMAEASHFAEELVSNGKPAIALNDPAVITAIGNDYGFKYIFSNQIASMARWNDLVIFLSTSGKSKNIKEGIKYCKKASFEYIDFPRDKGNTTEEIQNYQLEFIHKVYLRVI